MVAAADRVDVHVHVHVDGTNDLRELIMATRDEVLDSIATIRATLVELGDDVTRILTQLEEALRNNDLAQVAEALVPLRTLAESIDSAIEEASPEPPVEPAP